MQIVSCQYFSRDGRISEDLPKINVETQTLLVVTSNVKDKKLLEVLEKRVSLIVNLKIIF